LGRKLLGLLLVVRGRVLEVFGTFLLVSVDSSFQEELTAEKSIGRDPAVSG